MASGGRKRRLACTLDGDVLEKLSMKLNPRMLMKDYQSLAGRFKYTYDYILNFARERDPTLALLNHWWTAKRGKEKTVSVLIEHLSAMERDDCVALLQPYEFHCKFIFINCSYFQIIFIVIEYLFEFIELWLWLPMKFLSIFLR